MNNFNIYPWQKTVWLRLIQAGERLPHALLFHGRSGIGKYDFALHFSQSLLCLNREDTGHACGQCSSCNWFAEGNHPDLRLLSPEQEPDIELEIVSSKKTKKKTQISVAQIRDLTDFLSLSSHRSNGLRIVLIHPAESLNTASANALLKVLEEPAKNVVFILVTHSFQRLLPTIISRCQKLNMPIPDDSESLAWLNSKGVKNVPEQLAYFEGSPIKVFNEQLQFLTLVDQWHLLAQGSKIQPHIAASSLISSSVEAGVLTLQKWIYDIVALRLGHYVRYHPLCISALQALAEKVNLNKLLELQKKVYELRRLSLHPLNHDLQMEILLHEYSRIFQAKE